MPNGLIESPERKILGLNLVPAKRKRIAAQSVPVFRNQLRRPPLKIIVYILDDAHVTYIIIDASSYKMV